jgi:hypothetical protein
MRFAERWRMIEIFTIGVCLLMPHGNKQCFIPREPIYFESKLECQHLLDHDDRYQNMICTGHQAFCLCGKPSQLGDDRLGLAGSTDSSGLNFNGGKQSDQTKEAIWHPIGNAGEYVIFLELRQQRSADVCRAHPR